MKMTSVVCATILGSTVPTPAVVERKLASMGVPAYEIGNALSAGLITVRKKHLDLTYSGTLAAESALRYPMVASHFKPSRILSDSL